MYIKNLLLGSQYSVLIGAIGFNIDMGKLITSFCFSNFFLHFFFLYELLLKVAYKSNILHAKFTNHEHFQSVLILNYTYKLYSIIVL